MSSKKKVAPADTDSLKPLKVGSRVRCTDDGVEGRLIWANATAVKIRWDDGEQVTWRRDSLADRPLAILDPSDEPDEPAPQPDEQGPAPAPQPATEGPTTERPPAQGAEPPAAELPPPAQAPAPERPDEQAVQPPSAQPVQTEPAAAAPTSSEGEATPPEPMPAEPVEPAQGQKKRQRKVAKAKEEGKDQKLSALDAAAQVLSRASAPMNCQELIETMAAQGLWSSPAGKTPAATLYSALLREIQVKGDHARFIKADRGKFALRDHGAPQ